MPRRVNRSSKIKPLPQRNGIDAVALLLPRAGESAEQAQSAQPPRPTETFGATTVLEYLVNRFYPHDKSLILPRFEKSEVKAADGSDIPADAPLDGQMIWYYRELGDERAVPTDMPILYEDDWVLAIDKPHFLPTTPNGSYIAHTALAKLRVRENNPDLIPIHRLDRLTAGVVLFAKTPAARGPFQTLFQNRQVKKTYEAVAAPVDSLGVGDSLTVRTHIRKEHGNLQVIQRSETEAYAENIEINAESTITCLSTFNLPKDAFPERSSVNPDLVFPHSELSHFKLEPQTGKTHQLRAHMLHIGSPIAGDVIYPKILPFCDDETLLPLQLLARTSEFCHPFTGDAVQITSQRVLALTRYAPVN